MWTYFWRQLVCGSGWKSFFASNRACGAKKNGDEDDGWYDRGYGHSGASADADQPDYLRNRFALCFNIY